jgi:two-component system, cell cycle sensor histidine kinase and response regulator CckA
MGKTVLLVDDELIIRIVGEEMISLTGNVAVMAGSGGEAIEIFHRRSEEIDLIILDMNLMDMDGEEVFDEIRKVRPDIRVLVSSGYGPDDPRVKDFLTRGANGFIPKPAVIEDYQKCIVDALK